MRYMEKQSKKKILVSLTEEDILILNKLSNGYSKSATIAVALRSLVESRYPLISIDTELVGHDI